MNALHAKTIGERCPEALVRQYLKTLRTTISVCAQWAVSAAGRNDEDRCKYWLETEAALAGAYQAAEDAAHARGLI